MQAQALASAELLRIVDPARYAFGRQDHRRRDHGAGKRPSPGLVDAGDRR
jgi:hypothetical protein